MPAALCGAARLANAAKSDTLAAMSSAEDINTGESQALLEWMVDDHFTFLGYREYSLETHQGKSFLQPVAGTGLGLLSRNGRKKPIELTPEM